MKIVKCVTCGKDIKQLGSTPKRFCSSKCRAASWRMGETSTPCFYCGVYAEGIDHIPPRSIRSFIVSEGLQHKYPFIQVDACQECNNLLGNRPLWNLPLRKKFIKRVLRIRYARVLRMPNWTKEQIDQMGYRLQQLIEQKALIKRLVMERLAW